MLTSETAIVCPPGRKGSSPIVIDLEQIAWAESRVQEVAAVTPHKAPELLAVFNRAWSEMNRQVITLNHEVVLAEREANKLRAEIILDRVPTILKEKGLANSKSPAGSEDLRRAILDADEEYQSALEKVDEIRCVAELLKGKAKYFENAFTSVKRIMDTSGAMTFLDNKNLSGDTGSQQAGQVYKPGFGKPKP